MESVQNPFDKSISVPEIPLPRAPLLRVIAQVRFSKIFKIEDANYIANFQEELRHQYPIVGSDRSLSINVMNPEERRESVIWRFSDQKNQWRITLSPEFLSLESFEYESRADFTSRFDTAISALKKHFNTDVCERIGVRYLDQVKGPEFTNIKNMVRAEMLDLYNSNLAGNLDTTFTQTIFNVDQFTRLSARYGVLGRGNSHDVSILNVLDEPSWILDLDVFNEQLQDFEIGTINSHVASMSEIAYKFFRWVVTEEFLKAYGGKV